MLQLFGSIFWHAAVGIACQTLYDRVKKGKLRLISFCGEMRLLRSEVEVWKTQRAQRKQAVTGQRDPT
jgi:predicted site-specific integrase-resolvase